MKVLAMYLPQYHRVKENDEWWGPGFTDWVSTREATPLYDGHYEPHVPQNKYYYDLLKKESFEYQEKLIKKYGVDGLCMYHYWFKDGRQILERPAELLLEWKDIDIPFCFSWANQTWARSWAKVSNANAWCDNKEHSAGNSEKAILLEQAYGDENDWKKHYDYLKPFFKDSRYIKQNNKPVFVIYQAYDFPELPKMRAYWNKLALNDGFDGIFFVGANVIDGCVDEVLYPAPQYGLNKEESIYLDNGLRIEEYEKVYDRILSFALTNKDGSVGAFVGFDDTPRRGTKGCVVKSATPDCFRRYLTNILAINCVNNQPFTFINAWNEWGEGMHLEPDEKYGEAFLQAVSDAKNDYIKVAYGMKLVERNDVCDDNGELLEKCSKYEGFWRCYRDWIDLYQRRMTISSVLQAQGIEEIAVYGLGMLGRQLVNDISNNGKVKIAFGIDRAAKGDEFSFPVLLPAEIPNYNGTVIVTAIHDFDSIKQQLEDKGISKVVSLRELFHIK